MAEEFWLFELAPENDPIPSSQRRRGFGCLRGWKANSTYGIVAMRIPCGIKRMKEMCDSHRHGMQPTHIIITIVPLYYAQFSWHFGYSQMGCDVLFKPVF